MRTTATLIATLMLGVASCAYAQGGPGEGLGGGAGPGGGAIGIGGGAPGGDGPAAEVRAGTAPPAAHRRWNKVRQAAAKVCERGPGARRTPSRAEGTPRSAARAGDGKASRAERRANDDDGGKTGTEKSARRDKSEKSDANDKKTTRRPAARPTSQTVQQRTKRAKA